MKTIKKDEQKEKARGDEKRVIEAQLIKAKFLRAVEVPVPEDEEEAQGELMLLLPVPKKSAGCVSRVWPGNAICAEHGPLRSAQGAGTFDIPERVGHPLDQGGARAVSLRQDGT